MFGKKEQLKRSPIGEVFQLLFVIRKDRQNVFITSSAKAVIAEEMV